MTDQNFLIIGAMLALVGPIMFVMLARSVPRSQITYLPLSILVVVCIGSLLFSTACLTKALISVVESPLLSFFVIAVVQSSLMALSVRLSGQRATQLEGATDQAEARVNVLPTTFVEQHGTSKSRNAPPATNDEAIASELLGASRSQ